MRQYNLLDQRWVPCVDVHNCMVEWNVTDVLLRAQELKELRDPSPLVTAALHRLLLAILHRALEGPSGEKAWVALYKSGQFPKKKIADYLKSVEDRFELFGEKYPFYQAGGFELPKPAPVTKLAIECASGNNATLFDHTIESHGDYWPPAVCARWLVAAQGFALGGGVSGTSAMFGKHPNFAHGPFVGGASTFLVGPTLFHTLLLNLLPDKNRGDERLGPSDKDKPAWERKWPKQLKARTCAGLLDLLTWQSRCIRLIPTTEGVKEMYFAQGEILDAETRPRDPAWFYRVNKDGDEFRVGFDKDRALWRSANNLFFFSAGDRADRRPASFKFMSYVLDLGLIEDSFMNCMLLGLANDQAKPLTWGHEELPVPSRLLRDVDIVSILREGLERAENAGGNLRFALNVLAGNLLAYDPSGKGDRNPDQAMVVKLADSLQGIPRYWAAMGTHFRAFLLTLGKAETAAARDEALVAWSNTVRDESFHAFERASTNSLGYSAREMKARVEAGAALAGGLIKSKVLKPKSAEEAGV